MLSLPRDLWLHIATFCAPEALRSLRAVNSEVEGSMPTEQLLRAFRSRPKAMPFLFRRIWLSRLYTLPHFVRPTPAEAMYMYTVVYSCQGSSFDDMTSMTKFAITLHRDLCQLYKNSQEITKWINRIFVRLSRNIDAKYLTNERVPVDPDEKRIFHHRRRKLTNLIRQSRGVFKDLRRRHNHRRAT